MTQVKTPTRVEYKWNKKKIGRSSTIYQKPLNPTILKKMPSEVDTYIDVGITKLILKRAYQRISKIIES